MDRQGLGAFDEHVIRCSRCREAGLTNASRKNLREVPEQGGKRKGVDDRYIEEAVVELRMRRQSKPPADGRPVSDGQQERIAIQRFAVHAYFKMDRRVRSYGTQEGHEVEGKPPFTVFDIACFHIYRGIQADAEAVGEVGFVHSSEIDDSGFSSENNLTRLADTFRDAQAFYQVIARTGRNNAEGLVGMDHALDNLVHRAVPANGNDHVKVVEGLFCYSPCVFGALRVLDIEEDALFSEGLDRPQNNRPCLSSSRGLLMISLYFFIGYSGVA